MRSERTQTIIDGVFAQKLVELDAVPLENSNPDDYYFLEVAHRAAQRLAQEREAELEKHEKAGI